jgi:microcystin-dependent protein|tara:strand:- start:6612 stop:9470 length:2859 start_codon:yes stop_codon:yes gene_type:complete
MAIEPTVNSYWRGDGDGTNLIFTFPFSKFEDDDVFVYVYNTTNGAWDAKTVSTHYTVSGSQIIFTAGNAPASPSSAGFGNVLILRKTDFQTNKALFTAGSSIRAKDLEDNFLQSIFADQEFRDLKVDKLAPEFWADVDMKLRKIKNLADPTSNADAVNKKYMDDKRTNTLVQDTVPTAAQELKGLHWLQYANTANQIHRIFDGSGWVEVASGIPFVPSTGTRTRYVDTLNGTDAVGNDGFFSNNPLKTIKRAIDLVNADPAGDGSLVYVNAGIYQESLPISIEKDNVSIVGTTQRSCFIHPTVATQENIMFLVDSGTYISNFTFCGLKASGVRGGYGLDTTDTTYGLPTNQSWAVAFRNGVSIKKSPYIQNCVSYTDSQIDNTTTVYNANQTIASGFNPNTMAGLGGDVTSSPCGGGVLVDGAAVAATSPLRSMVVDAYTQINLDGPGVLCTNNGYAQLVSFFGTFCHYHAKARNGGQLNLSNCTTDFGRFGLIAEGKSPNAIATATVVNAAAVGATTFVCTAPAKAAGWHGTQVIPRTTQIVEVGGHTYPVKQSVSDSNGNYTITVYNPRPGNESINDGLKSALASGNGINFYQKSLITTGGHVFEYVGSGTDYSAHPDNGGLADITKQSTEITDGQVWLSSTDENGRFVVGGGGSDSFVVDQLAGTVTLPAGAVIADNIVTDTSPQLGGVLDTNGFAISSAGSNPVTIDPAGTGKINMGAEVVFDSTQPTATTASANIVQLTNDYQAGSTTLAATASAVKSLMPVGSVIMYAGNAAPTGYLECNGQSIAGDSAYAALRAIVGNNLPDLRGEFVRGWDNTKGTDNGRALLSFQDDQFKTHTHNMDVNGGHNHALSNAGIHVHGINAVGDHDHRSPWRAQSNSSDGGGGNSEIKGGSTNNTGGGGAHNHSMDNAGNHNHAMATAGSHDHTISNTGSTETRPRNIALMYCIKF